MQQVSKTKAVDPDDVSVSTPPKPTTTKKKADDSASYGKTIGGKLKLKGVEMKTSKKKKSNKGEPVQPSDTTQKTPSQLLQDRIKKKSDRYAMVTLRDDDIAWKPENS